MNPEDRPRWTANPSSYYGPRVYGRTHGRIATYNWGCRCEECRTVARLKQRRVRAARRS